MSKMGKFRDVHEDLLKFALIRFFDGSGLLLAGKTAAEVGSFLEVIFILSSHQ